MSNPSFGYQPNYGQTQPMPQYGIPSGGAPMLPGQGVNLGAPPQSPGTSLNPYGAINWNPVAGDPASPQRYMASPATSKELPYGNRNTIDAPATYRVAWENPIQKYFGNIAGPPPQDPSNPQANRGTNFFSPQTLGQLEQFFSTMTPQQMQQFTSQMPQLNQAFQGAAQAYANLYANPAYARGSGPQGPESGWNGMVQYAVYRARHGHDPYRPTTNLTQEQTADWLQSSYNTLTNRLNDAYLL